MKPKPSNSQPKAGGGASGGASGEGSRFQEDEIHVVLRLPDEPKHHLWMRAFFAAKHSPSSSTATRDGDDAPLGGEDAAANAPVEQKQLLDAVRKIRESHSDCSLIAM